MIKKTIYFILMFLLLLFSSLLTFNNYFEIKQLKSENKELSETVDKMNTFLGRNYDADLKEIKK